MADASRTLTARFDGDTTGLAAAARRGDRIVDKFGRDAPATFRREFDRSWARRGLSAFTSAAQTGLSAFGRALQGGVIDNPVISKGFAAAVLAAIVVGLPAVGAIAAGTVVFAFGAGLAGLALAVTFQTPKVQEAFNRLIKPIGEEVKQIAKPFEDTWVVILTAMRKTFDKFKPTLERAFAKLAPVIAQLGTHLFEALEALEPVIDPIVDAFEAIADSLGPALPGIVKGLADGIKAIADSVAENPDALTDFFEGLGDLVLNSLLLIAALNDMNGAIEDLTGGISGVDMLIAPLVFSLFAFTGAVKILTKGLQFLKTAWDKIKPIFSRAWKLIIGGDNRGFFSSLGTAAKAAGKWAASKFKSVITATGQSVFDVLRVVWEAGGRWARASFKATLGALNKVWEVLQKALELGREWAGKVFNATFGAIFKGLPNPIPRQHGGPISPGRAFLVGERGPEIIVPRVAGHVVPNHQLAGLGGGGMHAEVRVFIGDRELTDIVRTEIRTKDRRTKRALTSGALRGAPA